MISSILLALSLVGIKSKPASSAREETDDEKAGPEGKATIRYEYLDVREGASITAEVPLTITRDEVFPDQWQVRGSKRTTCSTRGQFISMDGSPRSIRREFEVRIYFDGVLTTAWDEGEPSCKFQLKNFFVTDIYENKAYENPPLNYKDLFEAGSAYPEYGALPEKDWVFDKYNRAVHVPRPESQTLKAIIQEVQWPQEMREDYRWE
jgi:hypothetical protein